MVQASEKKFMSTLSGIIRQDFPLPDFSYSNRGMSL